MKKYLGVKMVGAEVCNRIDSKCLDDNHFEDGYTVVYEDGYVSWSPKDVFEKAYVEFEEFKEPTKELLPHQVRVVSEAYELSDKVTKLDLFIEKNEIFDTLPLEERRRLQQQSLSMKYYLTILVQRINNF